MPQEPLGGARSNSKAQQIPSGFEEWLNQIMSAQAEAPALATRTQPDPRVKESLTLVKPPVKLEVKAEVRPPEEKSEPKEDKASQQPGEATHAVSTPVLSEYALNSLPILSLSLTAPPDQPGRVGADDTGGRDDPGSGSKQAPIGTVEDADERTGLVNLGTNARSAGVLAFAAQLTEITRPEAPAALSDSVPAGSLTATSAPPKSGLPATLAIAADPPASPLGQEPRANPPASSVVPSRQESLTSTAAAAPPSRPVEGSSQSVVARPAVGASVGSVNGQFSGYGLGLPILWSERDVRPAPAPSGPNPKAISRSSTSKPPLDGETEASAAPEKLTALDEPALLDKPVVDKPAVDKAAMDKPAVDKAIDKKDQEPRSGGERASRPSDQTQAVSPTKTSEPGVESVSAMAASGAPAGAHRAPDTASGATTPPGRGTTTAQLASQSETSPASNPPTRGITVRVYGEDSTAVDLRVTDRAGKVQVAVRTGDPSLARSMQSEIGDLVGRLEKRGYETETYIPSERTSGLAAGSEKPTAGGSSDKHESGGGGDGRGSGGQQPGDPERRKPRWVQELEGAFPSTEPKGSGNDTIDH